MDQGNFQERDIMVDLEIGGTSCEEDTSNGFVAGNMQVKKLLTGLSNGVLGFEGSIEDEGSMNSDSNLGKSSRLLHGNVESSTDENFAGQREGHVPLLEQKCVEEKCKMANFKKASKPPRPPKGPSLDAADFKLVKEMSELAMKKRARNERIKALKKMKAAKSSSSSSLLSSNSTLYALVITLLFCIVLIFQGITSKNESSASFEGSPQAAVVTSSPVPNLGNFLEIDTSRPSS